jgi:hypothetical protein
MTLRLINAARVTAPSPLVGEGITIGRSEFSWVRGTDAGVWTRSRPLTGRGFAKPPYPTRGEGKRASA